MMKKHKCRFIYYLFTFCLIAIVCSSAVYLCYNPVNATVFNRSVYINNVRFTGTEPLLQYKNETYYPLKAYADKFNYRTKNESTLFHTSVKINQFKVTYQKFSKNFSTSKTTSKSNSFLYARKTIYCTANVLKEQLGLHLHNEESKNTPLYLDNYKNQFDYSWTNNNTMISHALGGVDGHSYLNCKEGLLNGIDQGFKVFEVDLSITSDQQLVALHDWEENTFKDDLGITRYDGQYGSPQSATQFLSQRFLGQYTPVSFADLVQYLKKYKEIYLVLDTKDTTPSEISKVYSIIMEQLKGVDASVIKRIIPQVYTQEMYYQIMDYYQWNSIIYSLYQEDPLDFSTISTIQFAYKNGIKVITMNEDRANDLFTTSLKQRDIQVYMHTYNKPEEISILQGKGIRGFYTDFLSPKGTLLQ